MIYANLVKDGHSSFRYWCLLYREQAYTRDDSRSTAITFGPKELIVLVLLVRKNVMLETMLIKLCVNTYTGICTVAEEMSIYLWRKEVT